MINKENLACKLKKVFVKSKDGSISIMVAILVPAIVLLSVGIADACKILNEQIKIDRFMKLYGDFQLSNYDRDLYERYGLFGFEESKQLDTIINENLQFENVNQEIKSNINDNLYNTNILKSQINSFSAARIPVKIFNEFKTRMKEISSNNKIFNFENVKDSLKKIGTAIDKIGSDEQNKRI